MVRDQHLKILGGKVKVLLCGAGSLQSNVANYFRGCMTPEGKPVQFFEAYGATECGNIAVNKRILPHIEWKVLAVDGMPDSSEGGRDVAEGAVSSTGELVVKSGSMMFSGYFNDKKRSSAAFTSDGYYKTGDLVRVTRVKQHKATPAEKLDRDQVDSPQNYMVEVIGRTKTSLKLRDGRWVQPEVLEDLYRQDPDVDDICIYGGSNHSSLGAVVVLREPKTLLVEIAVLERLAMLAAAAGRQPFEYIQAIIPAAEPFSSTNGLLNPTGKLHRRNILNRYRAEIERGLVDAEIKSAMATLDPTTSFTAQGGDSLGVAKIAGMYQKLGIPLPRVIQLLLDESLSVGAAFKRADTLVINGVECDPKDDLHLPSDLTFLDKGNDAEEASGNSKRVQVLLTGATGFVGSFLLAELLQRGRHVTCVVRASSADCAKQRLVHKLVSIGRYSPEHWSQLTAVCGRVDMLRWGIDQQLYDSIAATTKIVVHLAAKVDLRASYSAHRNANVVGTLETLRFVMQASARLIFVSTTDVVQLPESASHLTEEEAAGSVAHLLKHDSFAELETGYATSKLVGEILVSSAFAAGMHGCIARLGMVGSDTCTGYCTAGDFATRLMIGFSHTGSFPATKPEHTWVHCIPVDVVAQVFADLASVASTAADHVTLNVVSGAPLLTMQKFREWLIDFGEPFCTRNTANAGNIGDPDNASMLPEVPFPVWIRSAEVDAALSVWPVLSWAKALPDFPVFNKKWAFPAELLRLVSKETAEAVCTGTDKCCVHKMLRYLFVEVDTRSAKSD